MTAPRLLNAALLAALWLGSLAAWPQLPSRIPIHFNLAGAPDGWARTSFLSWFGSPLLALALVAFLHSVGGLLRKHPEWLNVPNQAAYNALRPEGKRVVVEHATRIVEWLAPLVTLIAASIQLLMYQVAAGLNPGDWLRYALLSFLPVMFLLAVVFAIQTYREVRRQAASGAAT